MSKLNIKFIKELAKYNAPSLGTWDFQSLFYEGTVNQIEEVNGVKIKVLSLGKQKDYEFVFTTLDSNQFWRIPVSYDSYSGTEMQLDSPLEVVPEQIMITRYKEL